MHDKLETSIRATHEVLSSRLSTAEFSVPTHDHPRDRYPATDTFLASTSRHLAAANSVLVPAARKHLEDGSIRAHEFAHQSKRLEYALAQTKAKLYGEAHAIYRSWSDIWADVRTQFEALLEMEEHLVHDLIETTEESFRSDLADKVYRAELRSPTRPHPYIPHLGIYGRMARRVAMRVDKFWDTAEGRMVPEPVKPHDRSHDGKIAQYFLADPHLPED